MRAARMLFASSIAVLGTILLSAAGGKPTSGGSSFNVTITVYDTDANGVATHIGSDDYRGPTGYATYSSATDPNTVTDVYAGVTLYLDLYSQSTRTLFINADDPVSGSPSGPVPGKYWENVELYSGCWDASGTNKILLQSITTSYGNCRIGVDFYSSGVKYKLDMGPVLPTSVNPAPATGYANVQCNSLSGGVCNSWTITPNLNGPTPTVANLYYYAKGGKLTYIAQYYDTYRITYTNP